MKLQYWNSLQSATEKAIFLKWQCLHLSNKNYSTKNYEFRMGSSLSSCIFPRFFFIRFLFISISPALFATKEITNVSFKMTLIHFLDYNKKFFTKKLTKNWISGTKSKFMMNLLSIYICYYYYVRFS